MITWKAKFIDRAADRAAATIEYMGVNHRRLQIAVAQQLLNGADIVAIL